MIQEQAAKVLDAWETAVAHLNEMIRGNLVVIQVCEDLLEENLSIEEVQIWDLNQQVVEIERIGWELNAEERQMNDQLKHVDQAYN